MKKLIKGIGIIVGIIFLLIFLYLICLNILIHLELNRYKAEDRPNMAHMQVCETWRDGKGYAHDLYVEFKKIEDKDFQYLLHQCDEYINKYDGESQPINRITLLRKCIESKSVADPYRIIETAYRNQKIISFSFKEANDSARISPIVEKITLHNNGEYYPLREDYDNSIVMDSIGNLTIKDFAKLYSWEKHRKRHSTKK